MRNHGWHLPYHPLQIVAVAVFSALAFSFYVFFVPFVGNSVLKFHVIAAFSPLVFAVFTLYVRCAGIDPADSGIRSAKRRAAAIRKSESSAEILLRESGRLRVTLDEVEDDFSRNLQLLEAPELNGWEKAGKFCMFLCRPVVIAWRCPLGLGLLQRFFLGKTKELEKYISEEELLFCSLCEAEILKTSKHCRACDKCVDEFDHHCRWLNNCIGKKNYKTFVALMVASLLMLVMEWSIGMLVLVRCFSDKHKFNKEIVQKLGSSFTRTPFVVVVALCTFLAMLATLPLTQLLFFHLILIKKGITTYDYIVAIREQEIPESVVETHVAGSSLSSPASSVATAVSVGSSSGALHRAVWCTPPRLFVENQSNMKAEVVLQHATSLPGASPWMDLENGGGFYSRHLKDSKGGQPKRQIGLSPWKLARMSTKDATRAAVRSQESSSIVCPVKYVESSAITETNGSSLESSAEICTAPGGHKLGWGLEVPLSRDRPGLANEHQNPLYNASLPVDLSSGRPSQHVEEKSGHPIVPLHSEPRSPFRSRSLNIMTSLPTTGSARDSPNHLGSPDLVSGDAQQHNSANQERSWLYWATSDGYEASGGESADDASDQGHRLSQAWGKLKLNPSFIRKDDVQNATMKWSSGLEDGATSRSQQDSRASSTCGTRSSGSRLEANILKHVKEWPGIQDKVFTSTDGSNNSSPSHYVSPQQRMSPGIQSAIDKNFSCRLDKSISKESDADFCEVPFAEGSPNPMTCKRGLSSARRLKESILLYRRGLSARPGGALLSTTQ